MDFIANVLKSAFIFIGTIILALILAKFARFFLKKKFLIIIPAVIYVSISILALFMDRLLSAAVILIGGALSHFAVFLFVSFVRDIRDFSRTNDNDMMSLSLFLSNENRVFYKAKAKAHVNEIVIRDLTLLRSLYIDKGMNIYMVLSNVLLAYKSNDYNSVPVQFRCVFDFAAYNKQIGYLAAKENWINNIEASKEQKEHIIQKAKGKIDKSDKLELDKVEYNIRYYESAILLINKLSRIGADEPIKVSTESSCVDAMVKIIRLTIPSCVFTANISQEMSAMTAAKMEGNFSISFDISPIVDNTKLSGSIYKPMKADIFESANNGNAILVPSFSTIDIDYEFTANFEYQHDSNQIAFGTDIIVDKFETNAYKAFIMNNISKHFLLYLKTLFRDSASKKPVFDEEKSQLNSKFTQAAESYYKKIDKESRDICKEPIEAIFALGLSQSDIMAKLDERLKTIDTSKILEESRAEIDQYFGNLEDAIAQYAELVSSNVDIDLGAFVPQP